MFLWSYGMTIFTKPACPSDEFYLEQTDIYQLEIAQNDTATKLILDKKAKQLPVLTRTNTLNTRFCENCKCIKPDRAHHCSSCQQCVLKMDHHCPWANNCVGFSNYKFFILFLGYAFILCAYAAATSFEYFIEFWNEIRNAKPGRFHLLFLFFVSTMFAISVLSLLAYHIYLVARNCTTLESFRAPIFQATGLPDQNGFNLTMKENFAQVFGNNFFTAILPINTQKIDGLNYTNLTNLPVNYEDYDNSKITIIGSGWGRSSTIMHTDRDLLSVELPRNFDVKSNCLNANQYDTSIVFDRHQTSLNNVRAGTSKEIAIELDNSLDYKDIMQSFKDHESHSISSLNNSISFNNINTILKKNPNITIKTIIENYPHLNKSSNDGIHFIESDRQRHERDNQNMQNNSSSPTPLRSSEALLSNDRFQSVNENSVSIMMNQ